MRFAVYAIAAAILPMLSFSTLEAPAQNDAPTCNRQVITRHGNEITIGLEQLGDVFNQNLKAAHSSFSEPHLSAGCGDKPKVSGKNNGKPVEIGGPLQVVSGGALKLHANEIMRNGTPEKGPMDLTGKDLADYAHFKKPQSLSARGNDIYIHPDPLPNVSGQVTDVSLNDSSVTISVASQPCR